MAVIDWLILVVLLVSVLSAAKNGFFLEVFSLTGVIAGLLIASWNYQKLLPWVSRWIHSWAAAQALSFLLIALAVMILAGLLGRVIRWSVHSIGLGWADRFIGAIFGFFKGCASGDIGSSGNCCLPAPGHVVSTIAPGAVFPQCGPSGIGCNALRVGRTNTPRRRHNTEFSATLAEAFRRCMSAS